MGGGRGDARGVIAGLLRRYWLLGATVVGAVVGVSARLAGMDAAADAALIATAVAAGVPLALSLARQLLKGHAGVDVIALLALAGALALGEYLAAAVIALMVATGAALEDYASARAQRELSALLARAPRTALRVEGGELVEVAIAAVVPAATRRRVNSSAARWAYSGSAYRDSDGMMQALSHSSS